MSASSMPFKSAFAPDIFPNLQGGGGDLKGERPQKKRVMTAPLLYNIYVVLTIKIGYHLCFYDKKRTFTRYLGKNVQ